MGMDSQQYLLNVENDKSRIPTVANRHWVKQNTDNTTMSILCYESLTRTTVLQYHRTNKNWKDKHTQTEQTFINTVHC